MHLALLCVAALQALSVPVRRLQQRLRSYVTWKGPFGLLKFLLSWSYFGSNVRLASILPRSLPQVHGGDGGGGSTWEQFYFGRSSQGSVRLWQVWIFVWCLASLELCMFEDEGKVVWWSPSRGKEAASLQNLACSRKPTQVSTKWKHYKGTRMTWCHKTVLVLVFGLGLGSLSNTVLWIFSAQKFTQTNFQKGGGTPK